MLADKLLIVAEVADYLRVKPQTVYKFVQQRRIPFIKQGGLLRFRLRDLQAWERAHAVRSTTPLTMQPVEGIVPHIR